MAEKYAQLLAWFDRDRSVESVDIKPIRVTRARAAAARQFLREYSGIDIDVFHKSTTVEMLFSEPLGATPECLTAEELSQSIYSHMLVEPLSHLDSGFVNRVVGHVSLCQDCWSNMDLYQMLEQRSLARAYLAGAKNLPGAMWIGPIGAISQEPQAVPLLGISVMTYPQQVVMAAATGAIKLRVACPFESEEVTLWRRDRLSIPGLEKVVADAGLQPTDAFDVSLYQGRMTSRLPEITGRCGYVRISQEIGGQLIYSTRVIRFEKP